MAEKIVLFEDNMETQAGDFNHMQEWMGNSIDDLVVDAIDPGNAYTGLAITKNAATQVTIAPGRLYWGGDVYIMEQPATIDFQTVAGGMPVTQKRQIAIVAWGSTITTDVQPRNFVVDADTGMAQPESVAMTQIRVCNIGPIPGQEAPSPNFPAVPATNLLIGYVLLDPSGVVSIQQILTTQLANLTVIENQVVSFQQWQNLVNSQIATLQTALAALAEQLKNYVTLDQFQKLVDLVNQIWQIVSRPPSFALDTVDNFFDTSQSAVGTNVDGAYSANVQEGIRFAAGATVTSKLQLLNPNEPTIQAWDTFVLPKPSGMRVRMDCSFPQLDWIAERILNHAYWTFSPRKLAWARDRFRCGVPYLPCPSPAVFTWAGTLDPVYCNLRFDVGDTWPGVPCSTVVQYPQSDWDWPRYANLRYLYYWHDYVDVYYWSKVYVNLSYACNHYGQSFLNSQDGWLGGITVFSMVPEYYQPLTLLIFRCDDHGVPDHQQCIARLDLDGNALQTCYANPIVAGDIVQAVTQQVTESEKVVVGYTQVYDPAYLPSGGTGYVASPIYDTVNVTKNYTYYQHVPVYAYPVRLTFTPVFLEAGKRYSFHLLSTFDHQFACSADYSCYAVHGGDFWDYDGIHWFRVGGNPKSLRFMLHYLHWGIYNSPQPGVTSTINPAGALRYEIDLQPLQVTPQGIQSIDVLAEHIIPPATDLSYGVKVGGNWQYFAASPDHPGPLGPSTTVLPFRVRFTGTADCMPGVSFQNSQVKVQSPALSSYHHISTSIPRGGATATGIKITVNVTGYTGSPHHTLNCSLHYGATHMVPNGAQPVITSLMADGVTTQITYNFSQTGITAYQVELDGSTDGTGDNFVVSQRAAFSA